MSQPPPLAGIRVVDYSHFLAGPCVGRCLAALGAEVIKVERPIEGDAGRRHPYFVNGQGGHFLQQNMGKTDVRRRGRARGGPRAGAARRDRRAGSARAAHRRGAGRSADRGARHGHRATAPGARTVKLPNLPFRFSECDTTCRTPAPLLGQHNREVALMLGFSPGEIDAMARDGVLYSEPLP